LTTHPPTDDQLTDRPRRYLEEPSWKTSN